MGIRDTTAHTDIFLVCQFRFVVKLLERRRRRRRRQRRWRRRQRVCLPMKVTRFDDAYTCDISIMQCIRLHRIESRIHIYIDETNCMRFALAAPSTTAFPRFPFSYLSFLFFLLEMERRVWSGVVSSRTILWPNRMCVFSIVGCGRHD